MVHWHCVIRIKYGEGLASSHWPDWISQGDKIKASLEGPYPIPDALERAETLCAVRAFTRMTIAIQDRSICDRHEMSYKSSKGCGPGCPGFTFTCREMAS